ncbi:hypothetical protein HYU06_02160 [Candidatus Woesearchaeota archaeon]|nr:hypothetical protein [Candidatus Woesearchaeota archaeon]
MLELKLIYILEIIAFLFIAFALLKKSMENFLSIKVCAICAAVSTTWIATLLLKNLMIISINNTIISIMIGQTIVGIMYSYENYVKDARSTQNLLWLKKLLIIILGTTAAYYLIETTSFIQLCLILISLLILLIFALWFNKGFNENNGNDNNISDKESRDVHESRHNDHNTENSNDKHHSTIKSALLELEKKFERCCD